jgi:hypothetical protein
MVLALTIHAQFADRLVPAFLVPTFQPEIGRIGSEMSKIMHPS